MEDRKFATNEDVARFLELKSANGVYQGRNGTAHLRKVKLGGKAKWDWRQVRRHAELLLERGKCEDHVDGKGEPIVDDEGRPMGDCWDVFEVAQVESGTNYLRAVNKK